MNKLFCIPEGNKNKRFLIGELGQNNILCIGINPNTADEKNLDPTSGNIKRITSENGYDGWVLANLYPKRKSKAIDLEQEPDADLIAENAKIIESFILENNINDVWIAWGNDIQKRKYFKESVITLLKIFMNQKMNVYAIRMNDSGEPTHPVTRNINRFFKGVSPIKLMDFDTVSYLEKLLR